MTKDRIIATNNFDEAKEKFENANCRWRAYWWDAVVTIYNQCKSIAKKWIIDPVKQIITAVCTKTANGAIDWNGFEPMGKGIEQFYLISLLNEESSLVWFKIGTSSQKDGARMKDHLKNATYCKNGVTKIKVLGWWDCGNVAATTIESRVCKFLCDKGYTHTPKDRFSTVPDDMEELKRFINRAIEYENNFSFV